MLPGAGPLGELDLGDEPRLAEDASRGGRSPAAKGEEWRSSGPSSARQPLELGVAEARAHASDEAQPAAGLVRRPSSSAPIVARRRPLPR